MDKTDKQARPNPNPNPSPNPNANPHPHPHPHPDQVLHGSPYSTPPDSASPAESSAASELAEAAEP